jgi:hypothetical protein
MSHTAFNGSGGQTLIIDISETCNIGGMMNKKQDHIESIKQKIEEAIKKIEKIKNRSSKILNAEELEKYEEGYCQKDRQVGWIAYR